MFCVHRERTRRGTKKPQAMRAIFFLAARIVSSSVTASPNVLSFPEFPAPLVDYAALSTSDASAAAQLLHALSSLGVVAVQGIPGYAEARIKALGSLKSACLTPFGVPLGGEGGQALAVLADGSTRRTAGQTWHFFFFYLKSLARRFTLNLSCILAPPLSPSASPARLKLTLVCVLCFCEPLVDFLCWPLQRR